MAGAGFSATLATNLILAGFGVLSAYITIAFFSVVDSIYLFESTKLNNK
jgi:hypothetical protein